MDRRTALKIILALLIAPQLPEPGLTGTRVSTYNMGFLITEEAAEDIGYLYDPAKTEVKNGKFRFRDEIVFDPPLEIPITKWDISINGKKVA